MLCLYQMPSSRPNMLNNLEQMLFIQIFLLKALDPSILLLILFNLNQIYLIQHTGEA